jgi:RNA polymerase sigma factor (sigma-70 family)
MPVRLRALIHRLRETRPGSTDGQLVRAFVAARDEAAFAELVRRHGPMVLATCRRVLHPDAHAADDAFQAAFLVLATKADAVRPPDRVGAWLYGVAVRVSRRARTWVRKLPTADQAALDGLPAAPGPDPDAGDLRSVIDGVLAGLPAKYRAPIVLCDLEGRSRSDAAAALGWTEGTLSGRLARARGLLADRLARRGVVLSAVGLAMTVATPLVADMPPYLAAAVLRTAALVAAGTTADGIPAPVADLAQGVPRMSDSAFKVLAAGLLAVGGFALYSLAAAPPAAPPGKPATQPDVADKAPPAAPPAPVWANGPSFSNFGRVTALAVGPGFVAVGDDQGHLVLWDAQTGRKIETLGQGSDGGTQVTVDGLRVSGDGKQLYQILNRGGAMHQGSVRREGRDWSGFGDAGDWVYYGPTGDSRHWLGREAAKNELLLLRNDPAKGKFEQAEVARFPQPDRVMHAAGDRDVVVSVGGLGKSVLRRWEAGKDKPLWEADLGGADVTSLIVSPGGKRVAVAGDAGMVRVFDAATGKPVSKAEGLSGTVSAAAFGPDGARLVAGCRDGSARVLDAETGKELAPLKGHGDRVLSVAVGPDGTIATGGADKVVQVWVPRK